MFLLWIVCSGLGHKLIIAFFSFFFLATDAIVFVVDSVDVERMEEAKMELMRTAKSPDNSQVPILILANKQDLPGARDPKEIEKHLGLHELGSGHLYHIQPACAITGEGLDDGLDILYEMIGKRKKHSKMNKKKGIPSKWSSYYLTFSFFF